MPTLYRKYRPQTFSDVIAQEHVVQTIKNEIAANKIAHAYLFSGPRGVGKTTLARLLAKAVNCENRKEGSFEPCENCTSCQEITAGRNIDVLEIDAASHTGVENVRENIIENAQFKPTKSKYKVFIIDEVHMLSTPAFNALLKTIEEPPAHVLFILATTEFHDLPITIVSRCQRYAFKKIPYDLMKGKLEKICSEEGVKVDKDVLNRIINKSDGALRDAESLLGQILAIDKKKITADDVSMILPSGSAESLLAFLARILHNEPVAALEQLRGLHEDGINWDQFTHELTEVARVMMLIKAGAEAEKLTTDYSAEQLKEIRRLAALLAPAAIVRLIEKLMERRLQIAASPLPQLPLELFVVEWTEKSDTPTPAETLQAKSLPQTDAPPPNSSPIELHTITQSIKNVISTITHHRAPIKTELETVRKGWNDVIDAIGHANPSLTFILRMAKIEKIDDAGLHASLPYKLHTEKLTEAKNKKVIEECLRQKFGEAIPFICTVAADTAAPASADAELTALAVEFGGEVVN